MLVPKFIFPVTSLKARLSSVTTLFPLMAALPLPAATGGSISGTVVDPSGANLFVSSVKCPC